MSSSTEPSDTDESVVAAILADIDDPWRRPAECVRALVVAMTVSRGSPAWTCLAALGLQLAERLAADLRKAETMSDPVWVVVRGVTSERIMRQHGDSRWLELSDAIDCAALRLAEKGGKTGALLRALRELGRQWQAGKGPVAPPYLLRQEFKRNTVGRSCPDLRPGRRAEMLPDMPVDVTQWRLDPHAASNGNLGTERNSP